MRRARQLESDARATDTGPFPAGLTAALLSLAVIYVRGWLQVRRVASTAIPLWRAGTFILGSRCCGRRSALRLPPWITSLLLAHMVEHVVIASVAPPLIWLSAPVLPLWLGVPRWLGRRAHAAIASGAFRPLRFLVEDPVTALARRHVDDSRLARPAVFQLAQQSASWHGIQRASFFATGLLFW